MSVAASQQRLFCPRRLGVCACYEPTTFFAPLSGRANRRHGRVARPCTGASRLWHSDCWHVLELEAVPFLIVDVRVPDEVLSRPLSGFLGQSFASRTKAVLLPESDVATVLRPGGATWCDRFNCPPPGSRHALVFVSSDGVAAGRCASTAANLGFMRCLVLDGGLEALGGGGTSRVPRFAYISRHSVAMLLERAGAGGAVVPGEDGMLVVDVRRSDERALYGSLPGSVHLPVEQLPRALAMTYEEWARACRFLKPGAEDTLVFYSRCERRAKWAAQLAQDAGYDTCFVLRDGAVGWRFDGCVKAYDAYAEGTPPPHPFPHDMEVPNFNAAEEELSRLGML